MTEGSEVGEPDDLYPYLMDRVFGGFLRGVPEVLRAIEAFEGELRVVDKALTFTVPALFDFVRVSYESRDGRPVRAGRTAYLRFRKSLYGNRTNQRLKALGGQVEIVAPHPDHDRSVYRLVGGGQAE